jgi:hypothetical protein
MHSDPIRQPAAATASDKGPRPQKANAFKQELARAMEGAGPAATAAQLRPRPATPPATAGTLLAAQAAAPAPRPDAFRDRIALAEGSRHLYAVRNPASGALGRYQFVPQALHDLGWQDAAGNWTATAARHGVTTDAQFLASPQAQEAAMTTYLARTEQQLARNGALAQAGGTVRGLNGAEVLLTEAGLMAAAHRRGAGSVARYLAHRANNPEAALTPHQRRAFASVEQRLRDFAEMPYAVASRGGRTTPSA